ncbi:MAG: DUF4169 family protein [Devosiaceae bacterium]|nr:DUF4169 family protein [Devosiaceae bacterium]
MSEIINLRKARKTKLRATKQIKAEQNRIKFGQKKASRKKDALLKSLNEKQLDAHKIKD